MRSTALVALALAVLVAPRPALAQTRVDDAELAGTLSAPPANASIPPPAPPPAPLRRSRSGWVAFGVQTGFLAGGLGGMALTLSSLDDAPPATTGGASGGDGPPAAALAVLGLTMGGAIGGGFLFDALAENGDWDPAAGWGAAGTWPGLWFGVALAGGVLLTIDSRPAPGVGVATFVLGALGGASLGYVVWSGLGAENRTPGWILLMTWGASFLFEIVGLAIASGMDGGTADNGGAAMFTMAFGTVLGNGLGVLLFD